MSNEMAEKPKTIAGIDLRKIKAIDGIVKEFGLERVRDQDPFTQAMMMAKGISDLKRVLADDIMARIMSLQGTKLGFNTDLAQEGGEYPVGIVRDCFIEATLMGLRPVGNEWNIISSGVYVTKAGFKRLVKEWPGLTDLRPKLELNGDVQGGTTAQVPYQVSWKVDGVTQSLNGIIPVRVNRKQGADAVLGKAERKLLARVYNFLNGSEHTIDEGDVDDIDLPTGDGPSGEALLAEGKRRVRPMAEKERDRQKKAESKEPPAEVHNEEEAPPPDDPEEPEEDFPSTLEGLDDIPFEMTGVLEFKIIQTARQNKWSEKQVLEFVKKDFKLDNLSKISSAEAYDLILNRVTTELPDGSPAKR